MFLTNNLKHSNNVLGQTSSYNELIRNIHILLQNNSKIIQISGKSGSGKSTFVQYLVGNLISNRNNLSSALWINAGSPFSYKRLEDNFKEAPEQLTYIKRNIFLANVASYSEQQHLMLKLNMIDNIIPLNTKMIIVDSISHNFRLKLMESNEISNKVKNINTFFIEQIYPLQMLASRIRANLILVHEESYNPSLNKNVIFLYKMFDRIDSIRIELSINQTREKILRLKYHNFEVNFHYELSNNGFKFFT